MPQFLKEILFSCVLKHTCYVACGTGTASSQRILAIKLKSNLGIMPCCCGTFTCHAYLNCYGDDNKLVSLIKKIICELGISLYNISRRDLWPTWYVSSSRLGGGYHFQYKLLSDTSSPLEWCFSLKHQGTCMNVCALHFSNPKLHIHLK